jgi:hypothetical protein
MRLLNCVKLINLASQYLPLHCDVPSSVQLFLLLPLPYSSMVCSASVAAFPPLRQNSSAFVAFPASVVHCWPPMRRASSGADAAVRPMLPAFWSDSLQRPCHLWAPHSRPLPRCFPACWRPTNTGEPCRADPLGAVGHIFCRIFDSLCTWGDDRGQRDANPCFLKNISWLTYLYLWWMPFCLRGE